jgi:RNAse (barnase) inhibitor barstar
MKLPDLSDVEAAGLREHAGTAEAIADAAAAARLRHFTVDLGGADSKAALLDALAKGLALPAHFGHNYDALADCLEDDDVMGKRGAVVQIVHAAAFRKGHPSEWRTLAEILDEAVEFWRERRHPFWVFVS